MSTNSTPKRRVLGSTDPLKAPVDLDAASSLQDVLLCPICSESMVSLNQLNRHIDDIHSGSDLGVLSLSASPPPAAALDSSASLPERLPTVAREFLNGSVSRWIKNNFESAPDSASPVTLPQKRKTIKLDLLDKNKGFSLSEPVGVLSDSDASRERGTPSSPTRDLAALKSQISTSRLTRSHWKQPSSVLSDHCLDSTCNKVLNIKNGKVNCRKCGLLYCNEHTSYKARLQNNIPVGKKPDVIYEHSKNGIWARVCRTCYEGASKEDPPLTNDLTSNFRAIRQEHTDKKELHRNRATKRFIKLVNLHLDYYLSTKRDSEFWFPSSEWPSSRILNEEKLIVGLDNWKHDSQVQACPLCYSKFNFFTRRHHCRICGRIVCDGTLNGKQLICSMDVPLNLFLNKKLEHLNFSPLVIKNMQELKEIPDDNDKFRIRCCNDCKDDLLHDWKHNNDFDMDEKSPSVAIFKFYDQLLIIKMNIQGLYAKYQKLTHNYQGSTDLDDINKLRVKLMSFLRDFESLSALFKKSFFVVTDQKVLKPSDVLGSDMQKLVSNILQSTTTFLQESLINMKQLSNVLKDKEKNALQVHQKYVTEAAIRNIKPNSLGEGSEDDSIQSTLSTSSLSPRPVPAQNIEPDLTKRQIRELREELMVMNEQKFMIEGMIERVTKQRKFDELEPLVENKKELSTNIQQLETKLGEFGF